MPFALDQDKLDSPDLKMLDIGHPPSRSIPHQEYPKMVYLHPKDKTKEHLPKIVANAEELEAAKVQGFRTAPHVPVAPPQDLSQFDTSAFEVEPTTQDKRGPGRPKKED